MVDLPCFGRPKALKRAPRFLWSREAVAKHHDAPQVRCRSHGLTHTRWWEDIWGLLNFRTPRGHYALMSFALERDWVPSAASLGFLSIFDDNDLETSRTVLKRSWICRFLGISGSKTGRPKTSEDPSPKVLKHLAAAAGSAQDLLFLSWGHHERCQSVTDGLGHLMRDSARAARNHFISWINNSVGNRSKNLRWEIIAPVKRLRSTSSPEHLRWTFKMMQATCFLPWLSLDTAKAVREYPLDSLPQLLWTLKPPQVKIGHSLPLAEKMWSLFFPFQAYQDN